MQQGACQSMPARGLGRETAKHTTLRVAEGITKIRSIRSFVMMITILRNGPDRPRRIVIIILFFVMALTDLALPSPDRPPPLNGGGFGRVFDVCAEAMLAESGRAHV